VQRFTIRQDTRFDRLDVRITDFMATWGILFLRVSVGVVFLWFGFLKFFPGMSPAEQLAADTIQAMSGGLIEERVSLLILAVWETAIGVGLITGRALRTTLLLLFVQMPGTVMPMFFFPELTFVDFPFVLTLEGQYIVKNLVLYSAAIVIGGTVRGGGLTAAALVLESVPPDQLESRVGASRVGESGLGESRLGESGISSTD
jgi:uncharacterized membrane protein YphA (DoxX/SURF4 family)